MARSQQIQFLQSGLRQRGKLGPGLPSQPAGRGLLKSYNPAIQNPAGSRAIFPGRLNLPTKPANNSGLPAYQRAVANLQDATRRNTQAEENPSLAEISRGLRDLSNAARTTGQSLQRVPIPGGVWLPLSILLFLMFILVPVNGHTRITWFFLALAGLAHVQAGAQGGGGEDIQPNQQTVGSGPDSLQASNQQGNLGTYIQSGFDPGSNQYQSGYESYGEHQLAYEL